VVDASLKWVAKLRTLRPCHSLFGKTMKALQKIVLVLALPFVVLGFISSFIFSSFTAGWKMAKDKIGLVWR